MELRQATPADIGQLAYLIMLWRQELPEECRFFGEDAWVAERAAERIICDQDNSTKFLVDDGKVVGLSVLIKHESGLFSPYPYGVIFAIYVKPGYRGHKFLGYKLLCEVLDTAKKMRLSRVEFNPMFNALGASKVLKRIGFNPICTTHILELNHE